MKLGLLSVGDESWMGGVYYISNLVSALRRLPVNEQHEITLILSNNGSQKYYQDISSYVDFLPYAVSNRISPGFKERVKGLIGHSRVGLALTRYVNRQFVEANRYQPLAQILADKGISVLFPCIDSIGKNFAVPWIGWAWDLQHKYHPEFFPELERQERDLVFQQLGTDAQLIVTSSEVAKNDFNRFFPGHNHKLRVLHFRTIPPTSWYEGDIELVKGQYKLPDQYLMLPNQFWLHKNHSVVFEAVKILADRGVDFHLVCTGNTVDHRHPDYFQQLCNYLQTHHLEHRVRILGLIPRLDQVQIMRGAKAVIQPSLFEGWSTVVEDARALGKQVLLSNIPVHLEQNPAGAVYFNPHDPVELAQKITQAWAEQSPELMLSNEKMAQITQNELILDYARTFLKIAVEASQV